MIHTLRFSAIFTLLAAALSSGTLSAGPQDIDPDVLSIAQGHNRFALSLYATVAAKTPDNIFLSPDSVHTALSMTSLGARGKTGHEMSTVLHHPFQGQILASTYRNFLQALQSPSQTHDKRPAYELTSSNALWPAMNYPILPAYIELVQSAFQAVCTPLDYQKDPELARKQINDAVSAQTKQKIKDLIPQGMIDTQTRMVLTNAIYFRSSWDSPFSKEATREENFHLNDGEKKRCMMMRKETDYRYYENHELQMVEIPYLQYDLSMVLLLPRQEKGLLALEQSLSVETLAAWCSDAQMTKVDLCLPKFRFNATYRLKTPLNEMGMKLPFSSQGDFSGITKSEGLTIQEVIHKTFVAVDEKGTEAAAATGVIMPPGMPMPSPLPPKLFRADHPFVFLIKHRNTGAILFTARVAKPE